ncbi:hypothetical protein [Neisseria shayeganii]|nr:hypothetical protein [Neisseria shayeganii]
MNLLKIMIGFWLAIFLSACGSKHDKYVGYWQDSSSEKAVFVINKLDANTYTIAHLLGEDQVLTKLNEGEFEVPSNSVRLVLSEDGSTIRAGTQVLKKITQEQADEIKKILEVEAEQARKVRQNRAACEQLQQELDRKVRERTAHLNHFDPEKNKIKDALLQQYQQQAANIPSCKLSRPIF